MEDELNLATTKRDRSSKHVEEIQKEKKRVISFLNEKLRKKTDEAADLAEQLEGSKQEFDLTVRKYLTEIEDEENDQQEKQRVLNQEISQYNDEIKSLLHFREVIHNFSFASARYRSKNFHWPKIFAQVHGNKAKPISTAIRPSSNI